MKRRIDEINMDNKKVVIILGTYNGEKYVEEQLLSIINQSYKNIEIIVRDDGSTDGTMDILRRYESQRKIRLLVGNNIGFMDNYRLLISCEDEADYYSFADQDDIWMEDKIERAVSALEKMKKDGNDVVLYFCEFDYYDAEMKFLACRKKLKRNIDFMYSLVNFSNYAFTCVLSKELRNLLLQMPAEANYHPDYLCLQLATAFGSVHYDETALVKYRRHDSNVSITQHDFVKFQIWRVKTFLTNKVNLKEKWLYFRKTYGDRLNANDKKVLSWFTNEKYHAGYALQKLFYPKRYRETFFDEFALRCLFLVGKF